MSHDKRTQDLLKRELNPQITIKRILHANYSKNKLAVIPTAKTPQKANYSTIELPPPPIIHVFETSTAVKASVHFESQDQDHLNTQIEAKVVES
jgi:hypothetical protein